MKLRLLQLRRPRMRRFCLRRLFPSFPLPIPSLGCSIARPVDSPVGSEASPMSKATTPCTSTFQRAQIALFVKRIASLVLDLFIVDADVPLDILCKDDSKLEQVALGREFHVSLGRTVPIRVHQIDPVVTMLRQELQSQKRFWIDFSKWEGFVNDDRADFPFVGNVGDNQANTVR